MDYLGMKKAQTVSISVDHVADEEEQSLFEEVAEDIALALHSIKLEEERRRAEEALQRIEWLLTKGVQERPHAQPYGNLVELNTSRVVVG